MVFYLLQWILIYFEYFKYWANALIEPITHVPGNDISLVFKADLFILFTPGFVTETFFWSPPPHTEELCIPSKAIIQGQLWIERSSLICQLLCCFLEHRCFKCFKVYDLILHSGHMSVCGHNLEYDLTSKDCYTSFFIFKNLFFIFKELHVHCRIFGK